MMPCAAYQTSSAGSVRAVVRLRQTIARAARMHPCAEAPSVRGYARRRDARAHCAGIVTHE
jgi:hypothetical protein